MHRNTVNEDLQVASRHYPGVRVTMGQSMSSVLMSRSALVGHSQTIYQLSTSGCAYGQRTHKSHLFQVVLDCACLTSDFLYVYP